MFLLLVKPPPNPLGLTSSWHCHPVADGDRQPAPFAAPPHARPLPDPQGAATCVEGGGRIQRPFPGLCFDVPHQGGSRTAVSEGAPGSPFPLPGEEHRSRLVKRSHGSVGQKVTWIGWSVGSWSFDLYHPGRAAVSDLVNVHDPSFCLYQCAGLVIWAPA